jgi:hypothetical protein
MKAALTDRAIKAMRTAGKAYDVHDAIVPGLSLRILPSGVKSFVVLTRFPGARHPTRRALGSYGALTLEQARKQARQWLELIARGIDPAVQVEEERRRRDRERATTFAAVAEDYLDREIFGHDRDRPKKRSAAKIDQSLRDVLIPLFGSRPITALTADEIMRPLDLIARIGTDRALVKLGVRKKLRRPGRKAGPSPEQARLLFTYFEMVCNWALDHGGYGLDRGPLARVSKTRRLGARRTCRSTLSRLGVTEDVAEAVLAHQRGGVVGIYDRWHRLPEKRAALEAWSKFLADLIHPRPVETGTGPQRVKSAKLAD